MKVNLAFVGLDCQKIAFGPLSVFNRIVLDGAYQKFLVEEYN